MNALSTLPNLTDTQIIEAAQRRGEPGWLVLRREAAWKAFVEAVPPIWRRTDLSKFQPDRIIAPEAPSATRLTWDESLAAQGVIFMPLVEAAKSDDPIVRDRFGTAIDAHSHKFNALHAALWQDGAFLYVPKHVAAEAPFVASFGLNADGVSFAHNLVVLEEGSSASFVEEYSSADVNGQAFSNPATELFVGAGALLRYVVVQSWGAGVYHIGAQRVIAGRDATVEWVSANLGGKLQHVEAEIALTESGSRVEWQGVTFATNKQSLLTAPVLRHVGTNTESHLEFKTVVADDGYSSFDGLIKIEKDSKGTATRLEEHALHLGGKGRTDSIPGLKIDTNDVARAGHASTSGEIDEEQLFYMRARGISRAEAIHMIVMGFFDPVLERIPSEDVRGRVTAAIEAKL
ncbi:MAG: Fe-S cluster assembly protein SufD [Roseiflexaceae bacterium]|nr:Fe-S cluster assembly protein SufD [Roseiflexaceae bacterium]